MINIEYYFNKVCEKLLLAIAFLTFASGILSGAGIFVFQLYSYLQFGEWTSYDLNDLISTFSGNYSQWVENPERWIGLHKIFDKIPLSIFFPIAGCSLGVCLLSIFNKYEADNNFLFNS